VQYYNSGCWTELPCTCLVIADGQIEQWRFPGERFEESDAMAETAGPEPAVLQIQG
jgi:hypothetical protein